MSIELELVKLGEVGDKSEKWGYAIRSIYGCSGTYVCATYMDDHFLLSVDRKIQSSPRGVFGIVDGDKPEEADRRLYNRTLDLVGKDSGISGLINLINRVDGTHTKGICVIAFEDGSRMKRIGEDCSPISKSA